MPQFPAFEPAFRCGLKRVAIFQISVARASDFRLSVCLDAYSPIMSGCWTSSCEHQAV